MVDAARLFRHPTGLIDLLEAEGYTIKPIGKGAVNTLINEEYEKYSKPIYDFVLADSQFPQINLTVRDFIAPTLSQEGIDVFMEANMESGIVYMTTLMSNVMEADLDFWTQLLEETKGTKKELKLVSDPSDNNEFTFKSEDGRLMAICRSTRSVSVLQLIYGISKKSLNSETVKAYKSRLVSVDLKKTNSTKTAKDLGIDYECPLIKKFNKTEVQNPEHSDREPMDVYFQSWVIPETKDEFIVQLIKSPTGVFYIDGEQAVTEVLDRLKQKFNGTNVISKTSKVGKYLSYEYEIDVDLLEIKKAYLKVVPLCSELVMCLQLIKNGSIDQGFF